MAKAIKKDRASVIEAQDLMVRMLDAQIEMSRLQAEINRRGVKAYRDLDALRRRVEAYESLVQVAREALEDDY